MGQRMVTRIIKAQGVTFASYAIFFLRSSTSFYSESPFYHVPDLGSLHLPGYPTATAVLRVTIKGACVQKLATARFPTLFVVVTREVLEN